MKRTLMIAALFVSSLGMGSPALASYGWTEGRPLMCLISGWFHNPINPDHSLPCFHLYN